MAGMTGLLLLDVGGLSWGDPNGWELGLAGCLFTCIWPCHMAGLGFLTTWASQQSQVSYMAAHGSKKPRWQPPVPLKPELDLAQPHTCYLP